MWLHASETVFRFSFPTTMWFCVPVLETRAPSRHSTLLRSSIYDYGPGNESCGISHLSALRIEATSDWGFGDSATADTVAFSVEMLLAVVPPIAAIRTVDRCSNKLGIICLAIEGLKNTIHPTSPTARRSVTAPTRSSRGCDVYTTASSKGT